MSEEKEIKNRDEIMEELLKDHPILDMVSFNEFDISEKLAKNPMLYAKYRDLTAKAKHELELIEMLIDKVRGERYDYYRFEIDKQLQKAEIEQYYLTKDPKLLKLKRHFLNQKITVEFFETCARALEKQSWSMKNWLEAERMN